MLLEKGWYFSPEAQKLSMEEVSFPQCIQELSPLVFTGQGAGFSHENGNQWVIHIIHTPYNYYNYT